MAQSATFRCKICTAPHGGMHKAMCVDCAKKWKIEVENLGRLVRSLATDPSDFGAHFRKTVGEIERKLAAMKEQMKHA